MGDSTSKSGGYKNEGVGVDIKLLLDSDETNSFPIQSDTDSGNNNCQSLFFTIVPSSIITNPVGHSPIKFTTSNNNKSSDYKIIIITQS